jgi:hypothetical protein
LTYVVFPRYDVFDKAHAAAPGVMFFDKLDSLAKPGEGAALAEMLEVQVTES